MAFVVQDQATTSSNRHGFLPGSLWELPLFLLGCTKQGHLGAVAFLNFDLNVTVQIRREGSLPRQQISAPLWFSLCAKAVC